MKLATFTRTGSSGRQVRINPDHVAYIEASGENRVIISLAGSAALTQIIVDGSLDEVQIALEG